MNVENSMLNYRIKNFAVKVAAAEYQDMPGEIALSVTHNGYQWTVITLLPSEVEAVIAALKPKQSAN